MKLKNIKHIFFDLDHTLWDFERNSGLAFETIFSKNNITIGLSEFLEVYSPINFEFWRSYRNNEISKEALRYGRLKKSFDALGMTVVDETIMNLSNDYITHLPDHNHLFQGTIELLEYLKPKYNLHIITNGFEEVQHKKLSNSGISDYFDVVVTSEMAGVKKPNSKIFNLALDLAKAQPNESVMIGDSYEADIEGANAYGMHSIFFDQNRSQIQNGQLKAHNLKEIITFL